MKAFISAPLFSRIAEFVCSWHARDGHHENIIIGAEAVAQLVENGAQFTAAAKPVQRPVETVNIVGGAGAAPALQPADGNKVVSGGPYLPRADLRAFRDFINHRRQIKRRAGATP